MAFIGYYISLDGSETSLFPVAPNASEDDTAIGVYQSEDNTLRLAQVFRYSMVESALTWVMEGDVKVIESVDPNFLPFEQRSLNIYEPYGMGIMSMLYANIYSSKLASWGSNSQIGNDEVLMSDLSFVDGISGTEITPQPTSTISPISVFIKSESNEVVGVGTTVYTGSWRVLWNKLVSASGIPPVLSYDAESVNATREFVMLGNTENYVLKALNVEETLVNVPGVYMNYRTVYNLCDAMICETDLTGTSWKNASLYTPTGVLAYKMTNLEHQMLVSLDDRINGFETTFNNELNFLRAELIPRRHSYSGLAGDYYMYHMADLGNPINGATLSIGKINPVDMVYNVEQLEFPHATSLHYGIMSPAQVTALEGAVSDIAALQKLGGKWVGQNFETWGDMVSYQIPSTVSIGDYTYVLADEQNGGPSFLRTLYVIVEISGVKEFAFSMIDSMPATATEHVAGLVKSSSDNGEIGVSPLNGKMALNGYAELLQAISALTGRVDALETAMATKEMVYTAPTAGPLSNKTLIDALAYLNNVILGNIAVTIDHIA